MRKYLYILLFFIVVIGCNDEDYNIKDGLATLTLKINSLDNEVVTRAVASDEQERVVQNLYVFIINDDGRIARRSFFDNLNSENNTVSMINVPTGIKSIYVVANIDNTIVDIDSTYLENIADLDELRDVVSCLKGNFIERSDKFIMSGFSENITIEPKLNNTASVELERLDARVKFVITTYPGVTFTPSQWRVNSVSKNVSLFPRDENYEFDEDTYFNSPWTMFEKVDDDACSFEIYIPENKVNPKLNIPGTGSYSEQYALREERIKDPNNVDYVQNFKYASNKSTYIQFKGNVSYIDTTNAYVSAEVLYIVHLGGVNGVNDYATKRNTKYTYNISIKTINSILTEVYDNESVRPGAVGSVVVAKGVQDVDAHNEIFYFSFDKKNIDNSLTWSVITPFSNGNASDNPVDYKWIYFAVNNTTGKYNWNKKYVTDFRKYLGDDKIYDEDIYNNYTDAQFLNKYISDINSETDKLLNIDQLVRILKENKRLININPKNINTLFYAGEAISFTAFVRDYYYEYEPGDKSKQHKIGLWKKFVNTSPRIVNLSAKSEESNEGENSVYRAIFSIRQYSIQTMFNKYHDEDFTAWGSQTFQDKTPLKFEIVDSDDKSYADRNNGRVNSINMWRPSETTTDSWSKYINISTWKMNSNYEAAKYKCLRLNRDMNGDGNIDSEEVQWYLTSINQLTDLWLGEPAYIQDIKLYTRTTWETVDQDNQWFASSTSSKRYGKRDNPDILWSSEGSSTGYLTDYTSDNINTKVYYRCARNLGIRQDASLSEYPEDFADYDVYKDENGETVRTISVYRLDPGAIREFPQTAELLDHNERGDDGLNRPYRKFQINNSVTKTGFTWQGARDESKKSGADRLCPEGWRMPNQRELALMFSRIPKDTDSLGWKPWTLSNHFTSTGFSFVNYNPKRVGFSVSSNLYLINSESERGGTRCVRDVE